MPDQRLEKEFALKWRLGARLAGAITLFARKSQATIEIVYKNSTSNAEDIMGVMGLKCHADGYVDDVNKSTGYPDYKHYLHAGDHIKLIIQGPDAAVVMKKLTEVFTCDGDDLAAADLLRDE